jgi:hypothetical protein
MIWTQSLRRIVQSLNRINCLPPKAQAIIRMLEHRTMAFAGSWKEREFSVKNADAVVGNRGNL